MPRTKVLAVANPDHVGPRTIAVGGFVSEDIGMTNRIYSGGTGKIVGTYEDTAKFREELYNAFAHKQVTKSVEEFSYLLDLRNAAFLDKGLDSEIWAKKTKTGIQICADLRGENKVRLPMVQQSIAGAYEKSKI